MESVRTMVRTLLIRLGIIAKPDLLARTVPDHPSPELMEPGVIYVVAGKGYRKWAFLRCPSDHDEIIQLSLMTSRRPRWRVNIDLIGRPTIHPSVRQLDGTYAHFWVKRGRVVWCVDSGRRA
ncbi:hypothetical protein AUC71_02765 [Methyloceanibacter marginalis]|jgi:uncharacterized protein DUF6527|uniref:Uncharacterized protein n=1 Tax=Methyloceanibacter marginalis TaxID=1774971 RepID=A0A1E3W876_9HYPH|nr:DUF6527 family protein [Methyloceanibacter marginalis]ODS01930.1 hypothetical protein AUC71_02765 [Methyloceanibacter marginalis]